MRRLPSFVLALVLAAGCSDALEETSSAGQVIAVADSLDRTVSFVSAKDFSVRPVDLRNATGAPTTLAGRGTTVIVPLGSADSVTVIRNTGLCSGLCVNPVVVLPLASGSGATGVAIHDDSIAWIANPNLNTVTRLNYQTDDTSSVAVGAYPQAVAIFRTRVFVVNGNLVGGAPAGPSWLSSFDCCAFTTVDSIPLSGANAVAVVIGDDSLLYVVESGHPGLADGKLSIVDPVGRTELAVLNGLGASPAWRSICAGACTRSFRATARRRAASTCSPRHPTTRRSAPSRSASAPSPRRSRRRPSHVSGHHPRRRAPDLSLQRDLEGRAARHARPRGAERHRQGRAPPQEPLRRGTRAAERGRGADLPPGLAGVAHARRVRPREPAARAGGARGPVRGGGGARPSHAQDGAPGPAARRLRHPHRGARCARGGVRRDRGRDGAAGDVVAARRAGV